jgi:hypothetical protein
MQVLTMNQEGQGVLKFLKEYWFIASFIVVAAMGWSSFDSRISIAERQIAENRAKIEAQSATINQINENLASIKATLEFIRERLQ